MQQLKICLALIERVWKIRHRRQTERKREKANSHSIFLERFVSRNCCVCKDSIGSAPLPTTFSRTRVGLKDSTTTRGVVRAFIHLCAVSVVVYTHTQSQSVCVVYAVTDRSMNSLLLLFFFYVPPPFFHRPYTGNIFYFSLFFSSSWLFQEKSGSPCRVVNEPPQRKRLIIIKCSCRGLKGRFQIKNCLVKCHRSQDVRAGHVESRSEIFRCFCCVINAVIPPYR